MLDTNKNNNNNKNSNKKQTTISAYISNKSESTTPTLKRTSSNLSPSNLTHHRKKPNMDILPENKPDLSKGTTGSEEEDDSKGITRTEKTTIPEEGKSTISEDLPSALLINNIVGLLIQEMHVLRESVHSDYNRLHMDYFKLEGIITTQQEVISKLEASITIQQKNVSTVLTKKTCENDHKINTCLEENKLLRKENKDLKERLTRIELAQLGNNVIISGMQDQRWKAIQ